MYVIVVEIYNELFGYLLFVIGGFCYVGMLSVNC